VSFTATASPSTQVIANYHWVFGDGNVQDTTANQVTHTYTTQAGHTDVVTVTVTTTQGRMATGSTQVQNVQ